MNFIKSKIEGVYIIEPKVFGDQRGYFFESFSYRDFCKGIGKREGEVPPFVQDNQSMSTYGVVRGLHFQRAPYQQGKLVRVVKGIVLDVVLDLRPDSPTFGKYEAVELSDENFRQLYLPRGMAHGFSVLSDEAVLQYKCDNYYAPDYEDGIAWNDPQLAIDWRIPPQEAIVSAKDSARQSYLQFTSKISSHSVV